MSKQSFTTGQVLTAAQVNSLQANDFNQTVSVKTANYTLAAADKGTRIEFNTSASVTCTVNSGLFDAGDTLVIQNRGAGTATITAGTATVSTSASLALAQYSAGTLYFVSDSAALFFGDAAGISASIVDAKGDLIVGTADNTVARLAVGTNGHTLVANSSETTGLEWVAPAGGGKVLQVIFAEISTLASTTLTSFVNTGLTATITPSSASSKVLVIFTHNGVQKSAGNGANAVQIRLQRASADILLVSDIIGHNGTSSDNPNSSNGAQYLDSPNTTSATTYRTQFASGVSGQTAIVNNNLIAGGNTNSTMVLMEIGA